MSRRPKTEAPRAYSDTPPVARRHGFKRIVAMCFPASGPAGAAESIASAERGADAVADGHAISHHQGPTMNKDQVKGTLKDAAGKFQSKVGQLTGNKAQENKGIAKQVEGQTQKAVGDVEEVVKDVVKK
jgi:uncharacterized protein YjbJ (UPF0337 family)